MCVQESVDPINKKRSIRECKKSKKQRRISDFKATEGKWADGDTSIPPLKFRCSTCNKLFSSFRALGGHKSSCNKVKNLWEVQSTSPR